MSSRNNSSKNNSGKNNSDLSPASVERMLKAIKVKDEAVINIMSPGSTPVVERKGTAKKSAAAGAKKTQQQQQQQQPGARSQKDKEQQQISDKKTAARSQKERPPTPPVLTAKQPAARPLKEQQQPLPPAPPQQSKKQVSRAVAAAAAAEFGDKGRKNNKAKRSVSQKKGGGRKSSKGKRAVSESSSDEGASEDDSESSSGESSESSSSSSASPVKSMRVQISPPTRRNKTNVHSVAAAVGRYQPVTAEQRADLHRHRLRPRTMMGKTIKRLRINHDMALLNPFEATNYLGEAAAVLIDPNDKMVNNDSLRNLQEPIVCKGIIEKTVVHPDDSTKLLTIVRATDYVGESATRAFYQWCSAGIVACEYGRVMMRGIKDVVPPTGFTDDDEDEQEEKPVTPKPPVFGFGFDEDEDDNGFGPEF